MDCYYHDETTAVAVCRSCGKGLCRACGVDVGQGVACAGCETDARQLIEYLQGHMKLGATGATIIRASRGGTLIQGGFVALSGLGIGLLLYPTAGMFLGAVFILYGLFLIRTGLRVPVADQESNET